MDVHPPLAKLLITLAGWIAGFDGNFDFKDIGKDYLEPKVPYVAMRMLPAVLGILTVPLMFLTLKASGCRTLAAVLGAGVVIFGMVWRLIESTQVKLTGRRERIDHSIALDSFGFALGVLHCAHGSLVHEFHKPTRAGTVSCLPCALVVLAGCDGSLARRHPQC